ncbi:hypothetical protein PZB74_02055 [Porifericola rhodea]|uniref:hypothetical protein n=1 Tax=Porifericola rhodea TaxID=930972 RepID=UPI00266546FB|nr:hypothetical protein [Porifericola rhodea]WKN31392.1 hypothetical protein PZB74_20800 [Porifericola rhodea]WKN32136.1 hypothetical protein PZB74_02055 [Porifericola rhodea]
MQQEQLENYKVAYKTFKFAATEDGLARETNFELDKNTVFVTGFQLGSDNKSKLNFRGSLGLRIGGDTLLENGTPCQLFVSSVGVAVEKRFFPLGEVKPGNYKVELNFQDEDNAIAPFEAGYTVYITFAYLLPKDNL